MSTREIKNQLINDLAFSRDISSNTTTTSAYILDTSDYDGGVMFALAIIIYTSGTFALGIEHSDDPNMIGAVDVPVDNLVGPLPSLSGPTVESAVNLGRVGVVSAKKYLRPYIVSTNVIGNPNNVIVITTKMPELFPAIR